MPVVKNRAVSVNSSTYTYIANSGEPGVFRCAAAGTFASTASPAAGEATPYAANERHPHSGAGKLFFKTNSGSSTAEFTGS